MSLAKIIVSGSVVSEPEKRFTPNQNVAVTSFNLSVQAPARSGPGGAGGPAEPFTVKVIAWRGLADAVVESLHKGDEVVVEGKLMTSSFQTPEGVAKKGFEIELAAIDKLAGAPQPVLAAMSAGSGEPRRSASYSTPPSGGGDYGAPAQPAAAVASRPATGGNEFLTEELLTEDDIPF